MDIYIGNYRFSTYFSTLAAMEANSLMNTAVAVSAFHLSDALTRIRFQEEVKNFAHQQLLFIKSSASNEECQHYIRNLIEERNNLKIQDRMLRTGESVVAASVKIYQENRKVASYIIDGIGVVVAGLQMVAGTGVFATSLPTGNVIGMLAGATLFLNGVSSVAEGVQKLSGSDNPSNLMRDAYENSAQFLGFDRKLGLLAYQFVDLATSYYGLFKLTLKPDVWRLYRYTAPDFYRKVSAMSRAALVIKGTGAGWKGLQIGNNIYEIQHGRN
ncbi:DUF4225 domain-containing protein [Klebsiella aerogenes]|uniref:DUF4225 domain-containing protein n=3 Tax=Klebsiella aerogenes TaxID=548 RepID=A0A0H3FIT1_KLEAK|nr:DUF4225 domain-containing protein [Klebsiella aerogenes]AEG95191.1 hypothetical protein EAE_01275 [Klebsiella aerogenes KCTC 2190]KLF42239.1 hypothetical protein YA32_10310 [Klebsiella aerogenes]MCO4801250.1 DUF4225 domain-containing protein [Klebsiella aerogenes]MEC4759569.1 DUF4225 domain-containing protein [Klebsiella aerogenes]QEU17147.1 DUF4225 domain-containing protein [Klebsiella aerogenes]